jgi:hypothetical protein
LTYQIHCQQARGRPRKCGKSDSIVFASCASTRGHPRLWAAHEDATNRMSRRHAVHCESLTVLHTRPVRSRDYAPAPLHFGSMSRLGCSCHDWARSFMGAPCLRLTQFHTPYSVQIHRSDGEWNSISHTKVHRQAGPSSPNQTRLKIGRFLPL